MHVDDPALLVALDADDGVQDPVYGDVPALDLLGDRVDQEGTVLDVGLEHRADRLVVVGIERRIEHAHGRDLRFARAREVEQALHLGVELVDRHLQILVVRRTAQVGPRQGQHRLGLGLRDTFADSLDDAVHQALQDGIVPDSRRLIDLAHPIIPRLRPRNARPLGRRRAGRPRSRPVSLTVVHPRGGHQAPNRPGGAL